MAASVSRYRLEEQRQRGKLKLVAHNLAKSVMQFWHSAEVGLNGENPNHGSEDGRSKSSGSQMDNCEVSEDPNMVIMIYINLVFSSYCFDY